jgi:hypothetical protein
MISGVARPLATNVPLVQLARDKQADLLRTQNNDNKHKN